MTGGLGDLEKRGGEGTTRMTGTIGTTERLGEEPHSGDILVEYGYTAEPSAVAYWEKPIDSFGRNSENIYKEQ